MAATLAFGGARSRCCFDVVAIEVVEQEQCVWFADAARVHDHDAMEAV